MRLRYSLVALLSSIALASVACSSSDTNPAPVTVNLAGNWAGTTSRTDAAGKAIVTGVAITIAQSGTTLTGTTTVAAFLVGSLTGTISGSQAQITVTFPPGSYAALGSATCSATATTTASVTATTITGTLQETFAASCVGPVTTTTSQTEQLVLTKQ